jgi:DNA-binding SARP family transcriptional activator
MSTDAEPRRGKTVVHLFAGPYLTLDGRRCDVPEGGKRLLAFLSLHRGRQDRRFVAGALWPYAYDNRASGNLRSALWRLRAAKVGLIDADNWSLALADDVEVDVDELRSWSDRVMRGASDSDPPDLSHMEEKSLGLNLLPGCYDDWALVERERLRQRMLHALEQVSRILLADGDYGDAVDAAMIAVNAEPLRESAQLVLIEAHLAEGNLVEAHRVFTSYQRLLREELGVDPSPGMCRLLRPESARSHVDAPRVRPIAALPPRVSISP